MKMVKVNICIPPDILIQESETPLLCLINFVYLGLLINIINTSFFDDGAIFCPTIDSVEQTLLKR